MHLTQISRQARQIKFIQATMTSPKSRFDYEVPIQRLNSLHEQAQSKENQDFYPSVLFGVPNSDIPIEERKTNTLVGIFGDGKSAWNFEQVNGIGSNRIASLVPPSELKELPKINHSPIIEKQQSVSPQQQEQSCFNQYCGQTVGLRKVRQVKNNLMCKGCAENYHKGFYCDFCYQVYSEKNETIDNKQWIECAICQNWNHTECQQKYRGLQLSDAKSSYYRYQCQRCDHVRKQPARKHMQSLDKNFLYQDIVRKRRPPQRPKLDLDLQRQPIFNIGRSKQQNFEFIEGFLNSVGKMISLSQQNIQEDIKKFNRIASKLKDNISRNQDFSSSQKSFNNHRKKPKKSKKVIQKK